MPNPDRGVSEVLGFILIFGFLVISFTVYQGIIVPEQNRGVEFQHNQQVQNQLQDLRNSILTNAASGTKQTVSVKLGATYPDRTLAVNLGISAGAIQTVEHEGSNQIQIANATSPDQAAGVDDYWNGSPKEYSTKAIAYHPVYSFYSEGPVSYYENTLVFNDFGDETKLTVTDQALIDGKRITLVSLEGDVSRSGQEAVSLDPQAVSISTNRVAIRNDSHPITISIPTRMSADEWNETLWDEQANNPDAENGHVLDVRDSGPQQVTISLQSGTTYELRTAKVGVGSGVEDEPATYITLEDSPSETVANGSTHSITVQVRDRFNNPVTGFPVNGSISEAGTFENGLQSDTVNTTVDGTATFEYTAPNSGSASTDIQFDIFDGNPEYERVWSNHSVISSTLGGGGDGDDDEDTTTINPSSEQKTLVFVNATTPGPSSGNTVELYLNNTGASTIQISDARFQFYSYSTEGNRDNAPQSLRMGGELVEYQGPFDSVGDIPIGEGEHAITLEFFEDDSGTSAYDVRERDFIIITIRTDDGEAISYFIGITNP